MSEKIGGAITGLTSFNVDTLMPSLTDNADIQEALRLYHYGEPTGTGTGQHDPFNTSGPALKTSSVAGALYSLQSQISVLQGTNGITATAFTAKGSILAGTGVSAYSALPVGSNGQVLTANSGQTTGLQWVSPEVTLSNIVTLSGKTLAAPKMSSTFIADTNGNELIVFPAPVTSAVNEITVTNAITAGKPTISATGTDTNITLNLVSKGTGFVQVNGIDIDTVSGTQTLTNKTLSAPTITQGYITDTLTFEGSTADAFETTLGVIDPTADRTINLPNVDGTVITTGNLSSITTVGTVTAGSFPTANLSGTSLPSAIVSSSLTSVGTLASLAVTGNAVSHIAFNTTPTGAYTVVLADDGKVVEIPAAGAVTVPSDATTNFPIGTQITILQTTSGQVTIAGAASPNAVTVNATPGLKLRAQWSSCTLIKRGVNVWIAVGDLTA